MNRYLSILITEIVTLLIATELHASPSSLSPDELKRLTPQQQLGQRIFFDTNLSNPAGQSCASCHAVDTAFTDPELTLPVSKGAVGGRFGNRNAPSAMYSAYSPAFHFDEAEGIYFGGQFLDGRASDLIEQAKGPFLNPDEMNNADEAAVIEKISRSDYADLFKAVYGPTALDSITDAYQKTAEALAAFENTQTFNRFTSKFDYYQAGLVDLTEQEKRGLELFEAEDKGNCAACHPTTGTDFTPPLLTDFSYDNLGLPANPELLALQEENFVDLGLGAILNDPSENGKFKVPSLRNVAKTAPYMHNGIFDTLREAVEFYNTRDVDPKWGAPEVAENVNHDELGDLMLSDQEIDDIVAFLRTLSDGFSLTPNATFDSESGTLTIPVVRLEGNGFDNQLFSARMINVGPANNTFELTELTELSQDGLKSSGDIPRYSFDSETLYLPIVDSGNTGYIVRLQKIASETGAIKFQPALIKPLQ